MRRDVGALASTRFDLLVIGGGIVGACIARDAALRGLRVALIERGDFASGASWNSLKTVHGGLRSLQHFDLVRMREYIGDRSAWLRTAPHLVHLLPVVVPTFGLGPQGRPALRVALAVNDLIAADRNRGVPVDRRLPGGRLLSRRECIELVPDFEASSITGGAYFHDGQMYAAERLVVEVVSSAVEGGAVAANYVEAIGPLRRTAQGMIVPAVDATGELPLEIHADAVVNATGSASHVVAERLTGLSASRQASYSVALNIMVPGMGHRVAFAASERSSGRRGRGANARNLFVVPWRERTIIGTAHFHHQGDPACFRVDEAHVAEFLAEAERALPTRNLSAEQLVLVHGGLLPSAPTNGKEDVTLLRRQVIADHAVQGLERFVSVSSVRFTTARRLAERVVDTMMRKLGRTFAPSRTAEMPLPGAPTGRTMTELLDDALHKHASSLPASVVEHLVRSYGARYERVLARRTTLPGWDRQVVDGAPVIVAQLAHGVEEEMAVRPEDLLQRRTELGPRGLVTDEARALAMEILARRQHAPA
ncbi:MAG TPA: FAD-dependent oxidoreductase [Gemmatimonadaceae bacterium]|nr:FAD-dependent oxidoreductase [Gemmatimonadaceae bacterium]